jgi:hypothetical protein
VPLLLLLLLLLLLSSVVHRLLCQRVQSAV